MSKLSRAAGPALAALSILYGVGIIAAAAPSAPAQPAQPAESFALIIEHASGESDVLDYGQSLGDCFAAIPAAQANARAAGAIVYCERES